MENLLKLIITILFIQLSLGSCTNTKPISYDNFFPMEGKDNYSNLKKIQLMEISVRFSECGEWGGHNENINIYAKSGSYYLEYNRYCVDCSIAMHSPEQKNRKLIYTKVIELDKSSKMEIINFSKYILESKFSEKFSGNAGNSYFLKKYDTMGGRGFDIGFYGFNKNLDEKYLNLLIKLGIEINKNEKCILKTTLEEIDINKS